MKLFLKTLLLFTIFVLLIINICLATDNVNVDGFKPSVDSGAEGVGNALIGPINLIATTIALGTLAILGIRFMISAPSEKADIKSQSVPYLIGVAIIFCIIPILNIFWNIFAADPNIGGISDASYIGEASPDDGFIGEGITATTS